MRIRQVRSFVMADAHRSVLSLRSDRLFESSDATLLPRSPVFRQDFLADTREAQNHALLRLPAPPKVFGFRLT